jgi:hypothetical protein
VKSKSKKTLSLSFEEDEFLEFRKILFRKGLSVQEFFAHIVHKCVMHDKSIEDFYESALNIKEKLMEKGEELKDVKIDDVESMYDFIEKRLRGK